MAVSTKNTDALHDMLSRQGVGEVNALTEALKEINEERAEEKKERCKELLRKALDLQNQMNQAERQFLGSKKKFDKELGKLINRLKGMDQGKSPEEIEEELKASENNDNDNEDSGGE